MKPTFLLPLILALGLNTGCPTNPTPAPTPPNPPGPTVATCATACATATALNCPWARPTAKGKTCVQVCENLNASGFTTFNVGCRTTATTCAAADLCERGQ